MLRFTGSRYIFLRYAKKNTRTDETVFVSCKQDVTSSDFCKKSYREVFDGKTDFVLQFCKKSYREVFVGKTDFVFQFTGSRYIFYAALRKTLELTKPFSYRVNKTSLRVGFAKNRIEKFFDWKTICASIHWFSIHFSMLRYEKHSN
ncbi:MAG: hypothetical protein K0Q82_1087 [Chryseobacterium indoltheticum]|nr:hypothetical protein [Chryseobacterium indoltheticum]